MKKKIALFACILFILGSISTVYADENSTAAGSCSFTGKEMVSSFDSNKLAVSVSEMQPGDEVTFSVNIKMIATFQQNGTCQMMCLAVLRMHSL